MMSKKTNMSLEQFEAMLETLGADQVRWPGASREEALRLIEQEPAARALHAEHAALEKVLSASSGMSASQVLKDRIVAAAVSDRDVEARVVPIGAAKRGAEGGKIRHGGSYWPAAALAASFACGLYLGIAGLGDVAYQGAVQVSGLEIESGEGDIAAWLDVNPGGSSEGLL